MAPAAIVRQNLTDLGAFDADDMARWRRSEPYGLRAARLGAHPRGDAADLPNAGSKPADECEGTPVCANHRRTGDMERQCTTCRSNALRSSISNPAIHSRPGAGLILPEPSRRLWVLPGRRRAIRCERTTPCRRLPGLPPAWRSDICQLRMPSPKAQGERYDGFQAQGSGG